MIKQTIANGKVTVPSACWKIVVIVTESGGDDDLSKINADTRVIAIIMPNDNDLVGDRWAEYRTSVAEVERRTGYHFFDRLPADVSAALKQKVDKTRIASTEPLFHPTHGLFEAGINALESADVR